MLEMTCLLLHAWIYCCKIKRPGLSVKDNSDHVSQTKAPKRGQLLKPKNKYIILYLVLVVKTHIYICQIICFLFSSL